MCTTTHTASRVIRCRRALIIGLIAILILASLALIAGAFLGRGSITPDGYQADLIPVVRNLVIPVPSPAVAVIQPVASQISTYTFVGSVKPSLVPVPVLTPPL